MIVENCGELLDFLFNVSHELKILLSDHYKDFADIENKRVSLNLNTRTVTYTQDLEDSCGYNNRASIQDCATGNQHQNVTTLELKNSNLSDGAWYHQNSYIIGHSNFVPNHCNHAGCMTAQYYQNSSESAASVSSNNFVNFSQYSAKPSQRQDTGYASRDEYSPLIVSQHQATNNLMPNNQHQDYQQPECAYCSWLESNLTPGSTSRVSIDPIITNNISDNNYPTNNCSHHNTLNYS